MYLNGGTKDYSLYAEYSLSKHLICLGRVVRDYQSNMGIPGYIIFSMDLISNYALSQ